MADAYIPNKTGRPRLRYIVAAELAGVAPHVAAVGRTDGLAGVERRAEIEVVALQRVAVR